ncbi:transmembrane protein 174 [Sebastes umbrosus]|uniref:transmembrane protein 174 n=1 Tax=Sebastes umbrosus TaxID=72105 RepID=UPI00189D4899|nr:transmembrane protein 174 [Sebastes umbrosus]
MNQGFWTNAVVHRPVMETNRARNPTEVLCNDPTPRPRQPNSLLDNETTGAFLLFSGMLLTLVGIFFTSMGWYQYYATLNIEWTQLMGPILISVGGTFVLTSVCKFGIISLWSCTCWVKKVIVMPAIEQTSTGRSFALSDTNQPIMFHNAIGMLSIPPQYDFITQEVRQAVEFQPGVRVACPPYDAVCCVDNTVFTAEEEDLSAHCTETDHRRSRIENTENERGRGGAPPAYEDIYPSLN